MASTWICVLMNYFVEGWWSQSIDQYYVDSFSTLITVSFTFTILGPFFNAILRYRCKMDTLGHSILENYLWSPLCIVFFGGLSMHLSWALLAYLFSVDMQWGTTAKVRNASLYLTIGTGSIQFLEGITQNYPRFQIHVSACDHGYRDDGRFSLCCASDVADPGIFPLFTAWINIGESFCSSACFKSSAYVFLLLRDVKCGKWISRRYAF
jgi:hypothetical protein